MECGILLLILLVALGWYLVRQSPLLLIDSFRAITTVVAERGAFAVGCVAGTLSPLAFVLAAEFGPVMPAPCLALPLVTVVGAQFGVIAGIVWARMWGGELPSCAAYGGAGGAVASPLGLGALLFLALLFFDG